MILLVLTAFFVAPPSILSNEDNGNGSSSDIGDGWGSPVSNMTCKGMYDTDVSGDCDESTGECTGSMEFTVISESEGCVTESYGSICYSKTVSFNVGTAPCLFKAEGDQVICLADLSGLTSKESTDCKVGTTMN
jgi:hypothetical protein